jgi:hypothetical protein
MAIARGALIGLSLTAERDQDRDPTQRECHDHSPERKKHYPSVGQGKNMQRTHS